MNFNNSLILPQIKHWNHASALPDSENCYRPWALAVLPHAPGEMLLLMIIIKTRVAVCARYFTKGKARAELRPARRQARLPHSRSLLLPGRLAMDREASRLPFGPRSQASLQKAQGPGVCKLPKPPEGRSCIGKQILYH